MLHSSSHQNLGIPLSMSQWGFCVLEENSSIKSIYIEVQWLTYHSGSQTLWYIGAPLLLPPPFTLFQRQRKMENEDAKKEQSLWNARLLWFMEVTPLVKLFGLGGLETDFGVWFWSMWIRMGGFEDPCCLTEQLEFHHHKASGLWSRHENAGAACKA